MKEYSNTKYPVEYLVFKIDNPENIDKFIELDHKIWTAYLSTQKGFVSKEVWINSSNPGEVQTILIWENLECWKAIPKNELIEKDKEFTKAFGDKFEIARRIHLETNHGLFKVRHYEL